MLYIIGLTEVKEGSKKIIQRLSENERVSGSFIENAIATIKTENRLSKIKDLYKFGDTEAEQLLNIALELSITWINRILFLKLLEAQLVSFHKNEKYKFLEISTITNFNELNELFFDILAKQINEREGFIKKELKNIPYLNSSLFEISNLEDNSVRINSLKDRLTMPVYSHTVLTDKKKTNIPTLEYLFEFLNAFNFTNEGADEIQEENKSLINASVLGLIFEKINGYKEGSFFTPGYITMYMSRETIRRAVIQKFKENGYQLSEIDPLQGKLSESFEELKAKIENRQEANQIINSIKIIDPAVGSGHFLVSALNEIIAIKSELNILSYKSGRRILDFKVEVVNDDLIITNHETEEIFEYTLNKKGNIIPYKQDLQEAIFNEKQTIIENCLFGVDINPNSVNICRLRLWIELLKHTFYTKESKYAELETLPNIDINIKQGNSLVSNFGINGNGLANGQSQKIKLATQKYKDQVILYKSTDNKQVKKDAEKKITEIKEMFSNVVRPLDKDYKLLKEKEAKLGEMPMLFTQEDKDNWEKQRAELYSEIEELKKNLEQKR
ncbi:MAG: DNA methyltransferase, partial [Bacteroidota bacterium]|nr:DNA methyltransferase [Bacteroidota bacterium]